jgi:hypothetical protein
LGSGLYYTAPQTVTVDAQGNVITAEFNQSAAPSSNQTPLIISKLSSSGALLWRKVFLTPGGNAASPVHAVVPGPGGDLYFAVSNLCDEGGPCYPGNLGWGVYATAQLVKLSAAGAVLWHQSLPEEFALDLAVDGKGNALALTYPNGLEWPYATPQLTKYDSTGRHLWSRTETPGPAPDPSNPNSPTNGLKSIAFDPSGNIIAGGYGLFKLDPNGNPLWHLPGGTGGTMAMVATSPAGTAVGVGYYSGTLRWGSESLSSSGGLFAFVAESGGQPRWAKRLATSQPYILNYQLAIDPTGQLVAGGPAANCVSSITGASAWFVVKYDLAGDFLWSKELAPVNCNDGVSTVGVWSLAIAPSREIFVQGLFGGTVNFGLGPVTASGSYYSTFTIGLDP